MILLGKYMFYTKDDVVSIKIRKNGKVDLLDIEGKVLDRINVVELVRFWLNHKWYKDTIHM